MNKRHQWAGLATAAVLLSGCSGQQDSPKDRSDAAAGASSAHRKPAPPSTPSLPEGVLRLGASFPFQEKGGDSWKVSLGTLSPARPSAKASKVPDGWRALTTKVTLTNTSSGIAEFRGSLDITGRYGPQGRTAAAFTDTGVKGIEVPDRARPIRVRPGAAYTTTVGYTVPDDAAGQPMTITVEGGDDPTYLEGAIPGAPAQPVDTSQIKPVDATKELKFGDWEEADSPWLRVGQPRAAGATAQGKRYTVDLSFFNNFDDTLLGHRPGANLKVYAGAELTEVDFEENLSLLPSLAWIAPQRMATITVHFIVPEKQKDGSVSIEVVDPYGEDITYTGDVKN